jgi:hypothetical protein
MVKKPIVFVEFLTLSAMAMAATFDGAITDTFRAAANLKIMTAAIANDFPVPAGPNKSKTPIGTRLRKEKSSRRCLSVSIALTSATISSARPPASLPLEGR